jgi:cytochrome c5
MRLKVIIASAILALISLLCAAADSTRNNGPTTLVAQSGEQAAAMRLEGEKRFRENCGRCHAPPHKFPPRMMATIVRHMRVRATITDEDMRLVLFYMTQ